MSWQDGLYARLRGPTGLQHRDGTPLSATRTHGWEHPYENWSGGGLCSSGTIGHTGFTGTGLWIDFDEGKAWTLLTNRIHPTRHFNSGIAELRQTVGDLVNGS